MRQETNLQKAKKIIFKHVYNHIFYVCGENV